MRIKETHTINDEESLDALLNPSQNQACTKLQLTLDDEAEFVTGLKHVAICGIAVNMKR